MKIHSESPTMTQDMQMFMLGDECTLPGCIRENPLYVTKPVFAVCHRYRRLYRVISVSYSGLIALLSGCLFVEMKHCNDLLVQKHHCILFVSSIWRIECILFKNYIFCYYLTTLQLCCSHSLILRRSLRGECNGVHGKRRNATH